MIGKEQILTCVTGLFNTCGPKSLGMDQVAQGLMISKKSLYGIFGGKDKMIEDAITFDVASASAKVKNIYEEAPNVIYAIVLSGVEIFKFFKNFSGLFWNELKIYPESEKYLNDFVKSCSEYGRKSLKTAIESGFLLPDRDYEIIGDMLRDQVTRVFKETDSIFSAEHICYYCIVTVLRGVATEKGRDALDVIEAQNMY
ncbi:MAG: TetR/AcrR family transcriptional regulator [Bacteroidales bacterium]|jgi:AcrR family transcriptional regulator|nr:TetR/AcrR family transcriptional regulator [Bacteroidales bacterium]